MSWTTDDAARHTKKADTPEKKELWVRTANAIYINTADKAKAIRQANAAVRDIEDSHKGR